MTRDLTNSAPAFVLGGGANGLGVVRELAELGVRSVVFDADPYNLAFASRFAHRRVLVPAVEGELVELVAREALRCAVRPVLILTTDAFLGAVSRHRERLFPLAHCVLPAENVVECVLDKSRFNAFAWSQDLPIARGYAAGPDIDDSDVDRAIERMSLPILVKPSVSGAWAPAGNVPDGVKRKDKALVFQTRERLRDFLRRNPGSVLTLQEYIPGPDDAHYSYVNYRDANGEELLAFSVHKHRVAPIPNGVACFASLSDAADVYAAGRAVCAALGYVGASSICFKRRADTGVVQCYEVNGRVPLCHRAGALAGRSLAQTTYLDALGLPVSPHIEPVGESSCWQHLLPDLASSLGYLRAGDITFTAWLGSLSRVRQIVEWQWNDPAPLLRALQRRLLR